MESDWYKTKVGLFLGSFDPFHIGHFEATRKALHLGMDRVWIVPAPGNPWKEYAPIPLEIRVKLIRLALQDWGCTNEKIICLTVPTNPDPKTGKYYSVDQLREILKMSDPKNYDFCIIGGKDITDEVGNWKEGSWILENFKTLDIGRPGYSEGATGTKISSTKVREIVKSGSWGDLTGYLSEHEIEFIKNFRLYAGN